MGKIFLIADGGDLVELEQQEYSSEDQLQDLLARFPSLLPGDDFDPTSPRRWLLVSREAGIPGESDGGDRWSLDHLFLDQDGVPTLVEVKRSSDTRLRREVVGQMLEYAANGVAFWSLEHLQALFHSSCEASGDDPDLQLQEFIEHESAEEFWKAVKTNLQAGRIRLVFVADEIPAELQLVVEFLNDQMARAEVLAVEIPRYSGSGLETLAPRVIGQTVAARTKKAGSTPGQPWDEPRFLAALEQNEGPEHRALAADLMAWFRERGMEDWWGKGAVTGNYLPVAAQGESWYAPLVLRTSGQVAIRFLHIKTRPAFSSTEMREQLRQRFNELPSVEIPPDGIEKRPSFPMGVLSDPASMASFKSTVDWMLDRIKDSG